MANVRLTQFRGENGRGTVRLTRFRGRAAVLNHVKLTRFRGRNSSDVLSVNVGSNLINIEPLELQSLSAIVTSTLPATTVWSQVLSASGDPKLTSLNNLLVSSATTSVRMAFLGSSTTVGNNATTAENRYVNRLSNSLRTRYGASGVTAALDASARPTTPGLHTRNGGQGATTSANYVPSTRHAFIATLQPQLVMHMIGANDFGNSVNPNAYKINVQTTIDAIDAEVPVPVIHLLVNTYQRMDLSGSYSYALYGQKLAEIAADTANPNVMYFDLNPAYILKGVPGSDPENLIDIDNLHQTDAGHAFMAQLLYTALSATPPPSGSGPAVQIIGTGKDVQYRTPATRNGIVLTFQQVTVTEGGASNTQFLTHTINAHGGPWMYSSSGVLVGVPL